MDVPALHNINIMCADLADFSYMQTGPLTGSLSSYVHHFSIESVLGLDDRKHDA